MSKVIRLDAEVYGLLLKAKADLEAATGRSRSFNDAIAFLLPVATKLQAQYRGQTHDAEIVEANDLPSGRGVKYDVQIFKSLSAADKAVTGHPTNGWVFWRPTEDSQQ